MVASVLDGAAAPDHLRAVTGLIAAAQGRTDECRFACASADGAADRARNALVGAFAVSQATHLVLVDGAIGFDPAAVLDVIDRMQADPALAMVVAASTTRQINWTLLAAAHDSGAAGDDPAALARFSGQFVLDFVDPSAGIRLDQPVELATAESGLMVLRRDVIETLRETHAELRYAPEPSDHEAGDLGGALYALFQSTVDPASGTLLSGTKLFCYRARSAGFRLWLAPWLKTTNTGPVRFAGTLADLADLQASSPD
jgi:hypothetical protein